MHRSVNQYRPRGDPGGLPYAPQRDLAFIYMPMLREVFNGLDRENWSDYFKGWLESEGVTEHDLGRGVKCFMEAHLMFIRDRTVDCPEDAFEKAGFFELPDPVRIMIFERLGEVIMGGWFIALRDITMHGQMSPAAPDMATMVAAGRHLANRLSGHGLYESTDDQAAFATAMHEESERTLAQVQEANVKLRQECFDLDMSLGDAHDRLGFVAPLCEMVHTAQHSGFFRRVLGAAALAWRIIFKKVSA